MAKIKILYIIDYLSAGGGTERQMRELIVHLDRDRFEPVLVTLKRMDWLGLPPHVNPDCEHIFLDIPRLVSLKNVTGLFGLARYLRKNRFDIVHTFFQDANMFGVLAGSLAGVKSIVASRRDVGHWYTPRKLFVHRQFNRMTDYFLVNSEAVKQAVITHERFRADRIKVIPNGFFNIPDDSPSKLSKTDLGVPEDAPLVGMVANLHAVKRVDNFVRIAARVSDRRTHFISIGAGVEKDDLLRQAREAGLADRFQIIHTLENIFDYMKLFDVGLLTSDAEGLSNTLIEYQMCGKPAMAFDVGGNPEVIRDGRTGYLSAPGDLDGMVTRLETLLGDNDLRKTMGAEAAAWARSEFRGSRLIERTSEFYRHTLTGADLDEDATAHDVSEATLRNHAKAKDGKI